MVIEPKTTLSTIFSNGGLIEIPFFQRPYVWKLTQWDKLYDSIMKIVEDGNGQYLGTIIVKQRNEIEAPGSGYRINKYELIDGQQRLTTISLFFKAIFDSFSDLKIKNKNQDKYKQVLFYQFQETYEYVQKISLSYNDDAQYKEIMGTIVSDEDGATIEKWSQSQEFIKKVEEKIASKQFDSGLFDCYCYFRERLSNIDDEKKRIIYDTLLKMDNLFVQITLDASDKNEQELFDTINSSGVRLTAAELIKNTLFQALRQKINDDKKVIKFYNDSWNAEFENTDNLTFWNDIKGIGSQSRTNCEILLSAYAIIKEKFDPTVKGVKQTDLPGVYKILLESCDDVKSVIEEICEYARLYREFMDESEKAISFADYKKRLALILNVIAPVAFIPYVLNVLKNSDAAEQQKKLEELETVVVRRFIINASSKNYNKSAVLLIKNTTESIERVLDGGDGKHILNDAEVQKCLSTNVENKKATLLLFFVELYRREQKHVKEKSDEDLQNLDYNYTLEHIMPQKWDEKGSKWIDVPCYDREDAANPVIDSEVKNIRDAKVCSIGNMTLLKSKLNKSLQNDPFREKVEGKKGKAGYKNCASLSITADDIIKNVYDQNLSWDERQIFKREKNLIGDICQIWKL